MDHSHFRSITSQPIRTIRNVCRQTFSDGRAQQQNHRQLWPLCGRSMLSAHCAQAWHMPLALPTSQPHLHTSSNCTRERSRAALPQPKFTNARFETQIRPHVPYPLVRTLTPHTYLTLQTRWPSDSHTFPSAHACTHGHSCTHPPTHTYPLTLTAWRKLTRSTQWTRHQR